MQGQSFSPIFSFSQPHILLNVKVNITKIKKRAAVNQIKKLVIISAENIAPIEFDKLSNLKKLDMFLGIHFIFNLINFLFDFFDFFSNREIDFVIFDCPAAIMDRFPVGIN